MSIAVSNRQIIGSLFSGNKFFIPTYQRKYSWSNDEKNSSGQLKELWDDISEALGSMKHFFGTLIFKEGKKSGLTETYEIIDGQQRLTTLYILLSVLIDKLPETLSNGEKKEDYEKTFIGNKNNLKITPLGSDSSFLAELVFNYKTIDKSKINKRSQKLMYEAKTYFINNLIAYDTNQIESIINFIQNEMEVLILNVQDEDEAIKMFSIVNDRGLPLRILDKVKSVLMLYSTKYLSSKLNKDINDAFEQIFDSYDNILHQRDILGILGRLNENTIFTYHYLTSRNNLFPESWNYRNGADSIFENLKKKCQNLRNNVDNLEKFINDYITDFSNFSITFSDLLNEISNNVDYQRLFQFMEFGATMYPLIIRLKMQSKFDQLIDIIEKTELRVYKFNTSNPVADIYNLACNITANQTISIDDIRNYLKFICDKFFNDSVLKQFLNSGIYGHNGTKYLLLQYNNSKTSNQLANIFEYRTLQQEHIFSREPNFDILTYGFQDADDYNLEIHKLGNITLYEPDNSNDSPSNKADGYLLSNVYITNEVGSYIKSNGFNKIDIEKRTLEIITYCMTRY